MKIIYLLPWKQQPTYLGNFSILYCRLEFSTGKIYGGISFSIPAGKYIDSISGKDYSTFEEAAFAQDKWFLNNKSAYKYYLIPEDQVKRFEEKLKLLL